MSQPSGLPLGTIAPASEFETRTTFPRPSKSPISPELIEMMKVFVNQLQFSSDPAVALELLRHSVHLAQKSLEEPYDRVHYQTER